MQVSWEWAGGVPAVGGLGVAVWVVRSVWLRLAVWLLDDCRGMCELHYLLQCEDWIAPACAALPLLGMLIVLLGRGGGG